jgi:glycosyltransferase involved in cell wall biosynthesis
MVRVDEDKRNRLIEKLGIPKRFFFYPAQFWPHKNHYRIIEAAGFLKKRDGIEMPIVFVGKVFGEWNVLDICKSIAKKYSIDNQIYHFGYVTDEELVALYMTAAGLVMPTYFGPTNIPYIEAFYYKCPVIASDIPGIREQVGDAALLVDPKDTEGISRAMRMIWTDQNLREDLIKKGQAQLQEFLPRRFKEKMNSVINDIRKGAPCI